jgi:hypothetical protein
MKKVAFAIVIAAIVTSPALAAKKKKAPAQQTVAELNDPGRRFFMDSLPNYWPTAVKMVVYPVGNTSK